MNRVDAGRATSGLVGVVFGAGKEAGGEDVFAGAAAALVFRIPRTGAAVSLVGQFDPMRDIAATSSLMTPMPGRIMM